jgi:hypothetical protein
MDLMVTVMIIESYPIDTFAHQIECEPVWPFHVVADDCLSMGSIHSGTFDPGTRTPIGPVHPTVERIQRDGARNLQVVLYENFSHVAVEVHNLDGVASRIGEVNVIIDPVDGQSIGCDGLVLQHGGSVRSLVDWSPEWEQARRDN